MFHTAVVSNCFADSSMLEEACDRYVMDRTVESAFVCSASSEALQSALNFGFSEKFLKGLSEDDLLISVDAKDEKTAETVLSQIRSMAEAAAGAAGTGNRNPELVMDSEPSANWAVIRLPASLAPRAAGQAVRRGLGVILEEELDLLSEEKLKKEAAEKGIPFLGGGVYGAVISGRALGACPEFKYGNVSVLGQSFAANLILAMHLEERGIGIRHLVSTGRRDCFSEENGLITELCLDDLLADPQTDSICLVLKSGNLGVIGRIVRKAESSSKKVFIYSVGLLKGMDYEGRNDSANTIASLADAVADHYGITQKKEEDPELDNLTTLHRLQMSGAQKYLRGFFLSEVVCGETALQLLPDLKAVYSNNPVRGALLNPETRFLRENSVLDCAHMNYAASARLSLLASVRRNRRMESEAYNRSVAVLLADWYAVKGSTEEQLSDLAESIRICRRIASDDGRHLAVGVIVYACGASPVSAEHAAEVLTQAGADVFRSADEAAAYTRRIIASGKEHE